MKTIKLFLTFALLGIFQMASAQTDVLVTGSLLNTNSAAINVNLNFYDGTFATSTTVTTDVNGYYSHIFPGTASSVGTVELIVHDCNNDSILDTQAYNVSLGDTLVNFATYDYCPSVTPPPTTANVYASGNLINTNSAGINVSLVLLDVNGNTMNATAVTNANGDYSHTFVTSLTSQGTVYMQVQDCNSDSIFETKAYDLNVNDSIVIFTTADYCPVVIPPTNCYAYFTVDQALDANGVAIGNQLIVTDSSATTGTGNLTYTWNFGDGTTGTGSTLTHAYSGNGPYVLCLTIADGFGCTASYCDTISVDSLGMIEAEGFTLNIGVEVTLEVEKTDFSSAVNIYPNPAVNFINIEFNTGAQTLNKITMIDLSGKVVFEENNNNASNNKTTISTEGIAPGTYLIQMQFNNELYHQKVIIK
ncbi:hypothetical protein DNU06_03165 [Putridiphycobacter roseus]|uniref:PKD domain-containing protein n=1 Tax=Putridiphycobacter roseus TaxID=2219161 RepID=A0A2W1NH46_9FLAO|nr:T9SS type A sorting domain-containing protein [Putridiphycobacter roseus]PZE18845.1 hypothetical protein DNU06_03165 [Putridiphycobacter roseus]